MPAGLALSMSAVGAWLKRPIAKPSKPITSASAAPVTAGTKAGGPQGIGGWLLFFLAGQTIIGPLMLLATAAANNAISGVLDIALAGLSVYVGVSLWRVRPNALRLLKWFIIALLCIAVFVLVGIFSPPAQPPEDLLAADALHYARGQALAQLAVWLISIAIWWSYFRKSKRVRATYGSNL